MQRTRCRTTETPAFSIADHALALRWSALLQPAGLRIAVALGCDGAEEVVLVMRHAETRPLFFVLRLGPGVVLLDRAGLWLPYRDLADALMAIAPLTRAGRQAVLRGPQPACLNGMPTALRAPGRGAWLRRLLGLMAGRHTQ